MINIRDSLSEACVQEHIKRTERKELRESGEEDQPGEGQKGREGGGWIDGEGKSCYSAHVLTPKTKCKHQYAQHIVLCVVDFMSL